VKTIKLVFLFLLLITLFSLTSCSTVTYKTIFPTLSDGKYDSEFPYKGSSAELEEIGKSVYRINSTAFYYTYIFDINSKIKLSDLSDENFKTKSIKTVLYDQSTAGSATLLSTENNTASLLTCAHIVDYPDTIIVRFQTEDGSFTDYIESISIKDKQTTYAAGFPNGGQLDVILSDRSLDIAVIGCKCSPDYVNRLKTFMYPYGSGKTLEWGTFVYLFGYPLNYKMVTKAIVSSPNIDDDGSFITDAVINRGFSGGIVLAIKDGVPNFELVGMVQRVPKEDEEFIKPKPLKSEGRYNPLLPYEGELYVDKKSSIRYGIAKIMSIEHILEFINQNKTTLNNKGYYFNSLPVSK
jgi:hypothetical protein